MPTSRCESQVSPITAADEEGITPLTLPTPSGPKTIPNRPYTGDGEVVVRMLYGSWAHGTQTKDSDEDWRGIFQLPNEEFLGLDTPKTTFEAKPDQVYHEIGHFMRLLAKGNPNIVGMPFAPPDMVFEKSMVWDSIVAHRESFITKRMAAAYRGWLLQELDNFEKGKTDNSKRLSHVPRLAYELYHAVMYRIIPVRLSGRMLDFVMDVKEGRAGVNAVRLEVDGMMDEMRPQFPLLPDVNRDLLNELLLDYREWRG